MSEELKHLVNVNIANWLDRDVVWFLNPSKLVFMKFDRINYAPTIKMYIRVMDTSVEDIYHYYLVQEPPKIMKVL